MYLPVLHLYYMFSVGHCRKPLERAHEKNIRLRVVKKNFKSTFRDLDCGEQSPLMTAMGLICKRKCYGGGNGIIIPCHLNPAC